MSEPNRRLLQPHNNSNNHRNSNNNNNNHRNHDNIAALRLNSAP